MVQPVDYPSWDDIEDLYDDESPYFDSSDESNQDAAEAEHGQPGEPLTAIAPAQSIVINAPAGYVAAQNRVPALHYGLALSSASYNGHTIPSAHRQQVQQNHIPVLHNDVSRLCIDFFRLFFNYIDNPVMVCTRTGTFGNVASSISSSGGTNVSTQAPTLPTSGPGWEPLTFRNLIRRVLSKTHIGSNVIVLALELLARLKRGHPLARAASRQGNGAFCVFITALILATKCYDEGHDYTIKGWSDVVLGIFSPQHFRISMREMSLELDWQLRITPDQHAEFTSLLQSRLMYQAP